MALQVSTKFFPSRRLVSCECLRLKGCDKLLEVLKSDLLLAEAKHGALVAVLIHWMEPFNFSCF